MKPLIGLSGRQILGSQFLDAPPILVDAPVDFHWAEYAEKVAAAGGVPVQLPAIADPRAVVERLDGLLLTGGTDIEPQRYGATPDENLWSVEPERDNFESALLTAAVERGIPILGICRGNQMINVHFGGTLVADLPSDSGEKHVSMDQPRHMVRHEVNFEAGSILSDLYGPTAKVNSFHHQSVDRIGTDLEVVGRAPDGVVEAIEHTSAPIIGMQWHPEMMQVHEPIWAWLIKACG